MIHHLMLYNECYEHWVIPHLYTPRIYLSSYVLDVFIHHLKPFLLSPISFVNIYSIQTD